MPVCFITGCFGFLNKYANNEMLPYNGKMAWAFYFPWYSAEYWNTYKFKDVPELLLYNSNDSTIIKEHIVQAKKVGIDGFLVVWAGPDSYHDNNFKIMLKYAERYEFKLAIYVETMRDKGPLDSINMERWLEYIITGYADNPAYMKVDGKPVIAIFASGLIPNETWKRILNNLDSKKRWAYYIGNDINQSDIFDGFHYFAVFKNEPSDLLKMYQSSREILKTEFSKPKLWAATIQPGGDERFIPGRGDLYRARRNGQYYINIFEVAIKSNPDWIFITSWNEWPEHSYIEPSQEYGDKYLKITAKYLKKWR